MSVLISSCVCPYFCACRWTATVSVIFAAIREQVFGIYLSNSFTGELTQLVGFNYVDNWDLIQSGDNDDTTNQGIQYSLLEWESLIEVTGIFLAPNKISWYLIGYKRHQIKCKCTNPGIKKTLTAKIKEGITVPLRYLKLYEAMKILGIYLSPDINNH